MATQRAKSQGLLSPRNEVFKFYYQPVLSFLLSEIILTQLFLSMIKAPEQTLALTLDPTSCDHLFLTMKLFGQDVPGTLLKAVGERETPPKEIPKPSRLSRTYISI